MSFLGLVVTGAADSELLPQGNPARLTNGIDYDGRICGVDSGVRDRSKAYYLPSGLAVCVDSCPSSTDYSEFICQDDVTVANTAAGYLAVSAGTCGYQFRTKDVLNNCVYYPESSSPSLPNSAPESDYSTPDVSLLSGLVGDIYNNLGAVFGFGLGVASFVGFVFLAVLRLPGLLFVIIWGIVASVLGFLLGAAVLFYQTADRWDTEDPEVHSATQTLGCRYLSYAFFILTGLYFCLMIAMRRRINLAVAVVREAARAVGAMPMIVTLPAIQAIGISAFLVPWVIFCIFLASAGETKVLDSGLKSFEYTDNMQYAMIYLLFMFFWTAQFIVALGQLVVALAISGWYFTRDKSQAGNRSYWGAFYTALRYHMGTAAFGGLIIAIVQTIRAGVAYMQYKLKDSKNMVAVYTLRCLQCGLWCLEKVLRFIQKHAYIQTAIHGYSFCKAARCGFFLIARNILRVTAVKMVEEFVLFLGRLAIPTGTTLLAYIYFYYSEVDVNGVFLVLIFICAISYFVANVFLEVVGMAIETILQCFIADEELGGQPFATPELLSCMATTRQAAAESKVAPAEVHMVNVTAAAPASSSIEEPMP